MTTRSWRKTIRIMNARWSATVACGHYVLRGQRIIQRGGLWRCEPCDKTVREKTGRTAS